MNQTIRKILIPIIVSLTLTVSVLAQGDPTKEASWTEVFGALGSLGYYFSTFINNLLYFACWLGYWISVLLFFVLVGVIIFWLPLKLYPTFVQWYNILNRILKLT